MKLEVSTSLPGRLTVDEIQEIVSPFFGDKTNFTVTGIDYQYLDWSSILSDSPMSTDITLIAWIEE